MQDKPAKKKPAYAPRICEDCGASFIPKSSRGTRCPECRKVHRKEWRDSYNHDYYQRNQQDLVEYAAQYRAEHPDEHRTASLRWEQANPDRKRDNDAAYRERNRLSLRERWNAAGYPRNTPAQHASNARRRQRRRHSMTDLDRLLSSEYRCAIHNDPCFYCGKVWPSMEDDHFFPLSKGGTDHWWNIVRACKPCNGTKATTCGTAFLLRQLPLAAAA